MDSAFLLLSRFCVQLLFNFPHTPANPTGPTPRSSIVAGYWVNSWERLALHYYFTNFVVFSPTILPKAMVCAIEFPPKRFAP